MPPQKISSDVCADEGLREELGVDEDSCSILRKILSALCCGLPLPQPRGDKDINIPPWCASAGFGYEWVQWEVGEVCRADHSGKHSGEKGWRLSEWPYRCGGAKGKRDSKAHCFCQVQRVSWVIGAACCLSKRPVSKTFCPCGDNENDFQSLESTFLWASLDEDTSTTQTLIKVLDFSFVCGVNLCGTIKICFVCTMELRTSGGD